MKEPLTKKDHVPFTMVANRILTDKTLSWKAKGIWAYLYSKPEGWDFAVVRIMEDSADGRDATISGIQELEERGYLIRKRMNSGRFEYKIAWKPNTGNPEVPFTENPIYGKSQNGETRKISNTESESNKEEESNTEIAAVNAAPVKVDSFFHRRDRKDDAVPMSWGEFVLMCRGSAHRHVRLIGEFADETRPTLSTRAQWREYGIRYMRSARRLAPFTDKQIESAFVLMEKDFDSMKRRNGYAPKYTMETIEKYLEAANREKS